MGSQEPCIVPLAGAADAGDGLVGGKAARLAALIQAEFRVPRGFCEADLSERIAMELGRKPLDAMRWEALWRIVDSCVRLARDRSQTVRMARAVSDEHRSPAGCIGGQNAKAVH